jgi:hypothetical protein
MGRLVSSPGNHLIMDLVRVPRYWIAATAIWYLGTPGLEMM